MSATATVQHNLAEWNRAFASYALETSKTPQEALEHKVRALGVALWRGFAGHQWGGLPRRRGLAWAELGQRTAARIGTLVRASLKAAYLAQRGTLRRQSRELRRQFRSFGGTLDQWSGLKSAIEKNRDERISAWQDTIRKEMGLRQSSIGALAAAFLWYRYRGKGERRRLVKNRTGKRIGSVEVWEGGALIYGFVAGLDVVDNRYHVVAEAIDSETADMLEYLERKQDEAARRLVTGIL